MIKGSRSEKIKEKKDQERRIKGSRSGQEDQKDQREK